MNNNLFTGREAELATLQRFLRKKTATLLVIKGRRRIGKSRLVEEFAKKLTFYSFAGLAPTDQTTAQSQRDIFSGQLSEQTGLPEIKTDNWDKLFYLLAEKIKRGRIVLLFDEISWMGSKDPDFLGKIKNAWDQKFKKNPELIFILCGSASAWIEENILSSTGFLGRVSHTITLEELSLKDCVKFWGKQAKNISAFEKLKILSITGGVPRYLEEIDPSVNAEENIRELCFRKGGILVDEFEHIFSNIFKRRSPMYRAIVELLVYSPKDTLEISQCLHTEITGLLSSYLEELCLSGFIKRDYAWNLKTGYDTKLNKYRLSDNYLRFYLRYIDKQKNKIDRGSFELKSLTSLAEWHTIMGLQFENLVLNNRPFVQQALRLYPEDIVNDNPFFQKPTSKQKGCQIDYMIQTKHNTLYVCEIKFTKHPVGMNVIADVQKKIGALKRPKGFSCRPVLINVNGVTEDVLDSDYFSSIIDISKFLEA